MDRRRGQDRIDHRREADVGFVLQADDVERFFFAARIALVADRERARRQQPLGLQLLAAEAHDHHLAAEVRVQADVAQRADRDHRVGRVDGDAAAVGVLEADDVVDVRVARQQLGLDPRDRELDDAGDALHGRRDGQDVARADRAVGVAKALEGEAFERRRRVALDGRDRQAFERARRGHAQQPLMDPAAGGDRLHRIADRDAVAQHRLACADRGQRDLVAGRHAILQHQAGGEARGEGRRRRRGRLRWRRWRRCRARPCGSRAARSARSPAWRLRQWRRCSTSAKVYASAAPSPRRRPGDEP